MSIQLKDIFHFYLGCECEVPGHIIARFVGISWRDEQQWPIFQRFKEGRPFGSSYSVFWDDLKPIFRKVDNITDEEIKHLFALKNVEPEKITRVGNENGFIQIEGELLGEYYSDYQDLITMRPAQMQYLCKQGIDLFRLIDSGQAIDAKSIKPVNTQP